MSRKARSGFALLIVLIAVAIVMVLYFINLMAIWGPIKPPEKAPSRPWLEEERIITDGSAIKLPKAPKPELKSPFSITAQVEREQAERGQIKLHFTPDGKIVGQWGCSYSSREQGHKFTSVFQGNVDISKTYEDENGKKDRSRLYFITRGEYIEETLTFATNSTAVTEGIVYVTGWLGAGESISGVITITTDKTWSITFLFESEK
ncbi:MAG: hypothetical protein ACYTBP_04880 [Planctomycetota bacterium]|jgi:hypothetical protein